MRGDKARKLSPAAFALFCLVAHCLGQGTVTITFDSPQPQPPGTWSAVMQYSEAGMRLTAPGTQYALLLIGSGLAGNPDDGTTHLGTLLNTTIVVSSLSGVPFGLTSLDVANDFRRTHAPDASGGWLPAGWHNGYERFY